MEARQNLNSLKGLQENETSNDLPQTSKFDKMQRDVVEMALLQMKVSTCEKVTLSYEFGDFDVFPKLKIE